MRSPRSTTAGAATPSLNACIVACVLALLVLAGAGWQQSGRGLWQDEATLLANFGLPWRTYFHVLPYYDQAGPPLALLTLDGAYLIAHGAPGAMRLVLLGLHVSILTALAVVAMRKDDRAALLAIAAVAVSWLTVHFSLELKQYMFELQASLMFLLALRWWPARPVAIMALAALLSFFSFSIMLVVGVATLDAAALRFRGGLRWRWIVALALYTLGWLACYLLLFRPAAALQTANYPTAYERLPLAAYAHAPALLRPQIDAIVKAQATLAIAGAAGAILVILAWRRFGPQRAVAQPRAKAVVPDMWQPLRVLAGLLVLVILLWLARLYPVASAKQFLFTMPITALLLGQCVLAAGAAFASSMAMAVMLTAMLAPSALFTVARGWTRTSDFQDTRGLYAFVRSQRSAVILPDLLFEPSLRAYAAQDPQPPRHVAGWLRAESKPMETPAHVVADLAAGDVAIYQHVWQPLYASDRYPAYVTWLVGRARGAPEAIFAAAQFDARYEPMLRRAARLQGCDAREAFRSRGVVAYRLTCRPRR
jgi:hypothetical protein